MPGRWKSRLASLALIGCEGGHTPPTGSTQRAGSGAGRRGSAGSGAVFAAPVADALAAFFAALTAFFAAFLAGAALAAVGPAGCVRAGRSAGARSTGGAAA